MRNSGVAKPHICADYYAISLIYSLQTLIHKRANDNNRYAFDGEISHKNHHKPWK
jgi:hypothetical protein